MTFPTDDFTVKGSPADLDASNATIKQAATSAGSAATRLPGISNATAWTGPENDHWTKWLVNYSFAAAEMNTALGKVHDALDTFSKAIAKGQQDIAPVCTAAIACDKRRQVAQQRLVDALQKANSDSASANDTFQLGNAQKAVAGVDSEWQELCDKAAAIKKTIHDAAVTCAGELNAVGEPPRVDAFTATVPAGTPAENAHLADAAYLDSHVFPDKKIQLWPPVKTSGSANSQAVSIYSWTRTVVNTRGKLLFLSVDLLDPDLSKYKGITDEFGRTLTQARRAADYGEVVDSRGVPFRRGWRGTYKEVGSQLREDSGLADEASKFGKVMKGAKVLGYGLSGISAAYDSWEQDSKNGLPDDKKFTDAALSAAGEVGGGYVGGALGETAGEYVGGAAGSVIGQALIPIPGVGAAVGGVVGSTLGGIVGGYVGGKIGSAVGGNVANFFKKLF